jgi:hypothetical protein
MSQFGDRCGSNASVQLSRHVGFTPTPDVSLQGNEPTLRAKTGLMHRSKLGRGYEVRSMRVSISLRSIPKSIGLVSSA